MECHTRRPRRAIVHHSGHDDMVWHASSALLCCGKKKLPQHRNTRRKSFHIGRKMAMKFDVSCCDEKYKCSVAANTATKPQQTRNTPQQNATRTGRQWGQRCRQRRRQHCGQRCGQLPEQLPLSALLRKRLSRPASLLASSAAVPCFLARSAASVARQRVVSAAVEAPYGWRTVSASLGCASNS